MKKALLIVGLVVVALGATCGGFAWWVFRLTSPPVEAAERFFAQIGHGQLHEAWASSAPGFQKERDESAFSSWVLANGLDKFQATHWPSRKVENRRATLAGALALKGGKSLPITVELVDGEGGWRVLAVNPSADDAPSARLAQPSDAELRAWVAQVLADFDAAIAAADFAPLYAKISALWKSQITAAQLQSTFQVFIDKKARVSGLAADGVIFDQPPIIDRDGVLVVTGYWVKPERVNFRISWIGEAGVWKLISLKVMLNEGGAATRYVPPDAQLRVLAAAALADFDRAVKARDFGPFYAGLSTLWRAQTTAAELAKSFQPFLERQLDWSGIAKLQPDFDPAPAINEEGVLVVSGSYPLKPHGVGFKLKYVYEHPQWKLLGVKLSELESTTSFRDAPQ